MMGRPGSDEAAAYYFNYIDQVPGDDVLDVLGAQVADALPLLEEVSEERSLYRYAPGKWSLREVVSHINDTERVFAFRAFWFARGFDSPLPSFDQEIGVAGARPDEIDWARHLEEMRAVRSATLSLFHHLPEEAWERKGTASDLPFTVRALAFIAAGHCAHHLRIVRERYLG